MTTAQLLPPTAQPTEEISPSPQPATRISFRQPVSATGFIDAAWWPRTLDLTAELPPLMDVLWTAGREINRVTYNVAAWDPAPRQMRIENRKIRLGGFATSDLLTVRLSDAWGRERIDILVIAPGTGSAIAERALRIASRAGDPLRAAEILAQANGTDEFEADGRVMSTTQQLAPESTDVRAEQHCAVCDHNLSGHDAISQRFCRATQTNALTRDCICRGSA